MTLKQWGSDQWGIQSQFLSICSLPLMYHCCRFLLPNPGHRLRHLSQLSLVGISSPSRLLPDVAVNPPRIALPPSEAPSYTRPAVTQSVSDMSAGSRIALLAAVVTQAATSIEPVAAPATDTGQRRSSRSAVPVASIQPAAAPATNTGQRLSRRHATGSEDNTQALYPNIRHHVSALTAFCANTSRQHWSPLKTFDRCVTYRRSSPLHHIACADASSASCFTTRKFRSGRLLMAEESAVFSRRSNQQTMTLMSIIEEAVPALFPAFTLHSASMLGELCAVPDVPAAVCRRQWKPGLQCQHCCSCCRCFRPCCSRPPPSEDQRPAAQSGGVGV